ncbi:hypothetical protein K440DRAFT_642216 [Wilcoxina mikolae CBS 423.85]|nr:hypothetical protein K440DRAFT_642216 [Wilcoxina mikolae CBS 423.85]
MAALGIAASIIAVITAALQSAKVIHQILSGIKDGPHHVVELSTKVNDSQAILKQLQNFDRSRNVFDELKKSIVPCADDLAVFETKLAKLQNTPGEGRWVRIRKGVGIVLREGDFLSMHRKISHYIKVLGVQVGIVGMGVQLEHGTIFNVLETKVLEIDDQLIQQSAVANRNSEKLDTIEQFSAFQFNQNQISHRETLHEVHTVANKMEELVNMSSGQFGSILALLQQIRNDQSTHANSNLGRPGHLYNPVPPILDTGKQQEQFFTASASQVMSNKILESIDRIYRLAEKKGTTIHSREAQTIICDLENFLDIVSQDTNLRRQTGHGKRKREAGEFENQWDIHHLKRVRGLLGSAPGIDMNQNVHKQMSGRFPYYYEAGGSMTRPESKMYQEIRYSQGL